MLFVDDAKNCVPCMSRCCLTKRIFVSVCKCLIGAVFVLPNMILSAVFGVVCNFIVYWKCQGPRLDWHSLLSSVCAGCILIRRFRFVQMCLLVMSVFSLGLHLVTMLSMLGRECWAFISAYEPCSGRSEEESNRLHFGMS